MPDNRPHRVVMLAFPDAQVLDITGPLEVFSRASRWLVEKGIVARPPYEIEITARNSGPVRMSSGLELVARRSLAVVDDVDTLIISGGIGYDAVREDPEQLRWIRETANQSERIVSICTGALILARAGLLHGLKATTHWHYCEELAAECPDVDVLADDIYVRQGKIYTSAGVTAGMDLALALIEEDWGRETALAVAQELVMFLKRPGGQSQFSAFIEAQHSPSDRFRDLQVWIQSHLDLDLGVETLAGRMAMSPRNFARSFVRETGITPARYVQKCRLEAARRELEDSRRSVEQVAARCGFGNAETLRRTFVQQLRVAPSEYRQRFQSASR